MTPVQIAFLILGICILFIICIACIFRKYTNQEKLEYFQTVQQLPHPVSIEDTGKNIVPLVTFNAVQNSHNLFHQQIIESKVQPRLLNESQAPTRKNRKIKKSQIQSSASQNQSNTIQTEMKEIQEQI